MKTKRLKLAVCLLIGVALFFGLDVPQFFLPDWSPLARTALDAGGQLLAYAGMAALALWAGPALNGRGGPTAHP
jgi:hypothetical protein